MNRDGRVKPGYDKQIGGSHTPFAITPASATAG
jgi:hypothetical protein